MRFRQLALLGTLLLLSCSFAARTDNVAGQSTPVDIARNKIVQAFQLVQQADMAGAPPALLFRLADHLNPASPHKQNATPLISTNKTGSRGVGSLVSDLTATSSVPAMSAACAG